MKDTSKTKAQLISELKELRKIIAVDKIKSTTIKPEYKTLSFAEKATGFGVYQVEINKNQIYGTQNIFVSPIIEEIFQTDELNGKTSWFSSLHTDDKDRVMRAHITSRDTGKTFDETFRVFHNQKKEWRWIHAISAPVISGDGNFSTFNDVLIDITESKRIEKNLFHKTTMLDNILRSANDISIITIDLNKVITYFNPTAEKIFSLSALDVIGKTITEMHKNMAISASKVDEILETVRVTGEYTFTIKRKTPEGVKYIQSRISDIFNSNSKLVGYSLFTRDITESKQAENILRESEEKYKNLVESTADWVWAFDLKGNLTFSNNAIKELLGFEIQEVINGSTLSLTHPDDTKIAKTMIKNAIKSKKGWSNVEIRWIHKNKSIRIFESSSRPVFNEENVLIGFTGIDRDITEQIKTLEALHKSEFDLRSLFNSMTDIVLELDYNGKYINIAPTSPELLYKPPATLIGKHLFDAFPKKDAIKFLKNIQKCIDEKKHQTIEYSLTVEDKTIWFEGRITPKTQNTALFIASDITNRKQAQLERTRFMRAIEQTGETIIITNTDGIVEYINPAFERVSGYSKDEVIGRNPSILQSGLHEPSFYANMWAQITAGKNWTGQIVNKNKNGSLYTEKVTISPVLDSTGKITNYVAVKQDVSAEIELQEQLRQSQKMEAIGQLAGGIAHDFNNLLQVMNGYTDLILEELNPKHPTYDFVSEVKVAGHRASALVNQLLSFSKQQIMKPVDLDLNLLTGNLMKMINRVIGEHINCSFIPGHELETIYADSGQLEQVLINLCVNSRDALPEGGNITIETTNVLVNSKYRKTYPLAKEGEFVLLSISDDGTGMTKQTQENLFEPFFTTKSIGKGTGLGLATVYGIVKQHNGNIQVYSKLGKGSVFKIYFPIVKRIANGIPSNLADEAIGGTETILIAEDDDKVRDLTQKMLVAAGYTIIAARDGNEAINLLQEYPGKIDFLFLDIVMPKASGKEVYDSMDRNQKIIPTLFCSGYIPDGIHNNFVLDSTLNFIQKPYQPNKLLRTIRAILDT